MNIPMSFGGADYRGTNTRFCVFCKKPIYDRYSWHIFENKTGDKITLCERHYKIWEDKQEDALLKLSEEFRAALNSLDDGNRY